ncbi:MAG: hypothetical protein WCJ24_03470, partial [Candidatus Saccharibacteria bacterium]
RLILCLAFVLVLTTSRVHAAALSPGCYTDMGDKGLQSISCDMLKMVYPNAQIDAAKCYKSNAAPAYSSPAEFDCSTMTAGAPVDTTPVASTPASTISRDEAINCPNGNTPAGLQDCLKNHNPLIAQFEAFINFLGIGVGVIIVIMIIIGGIQYTSAGSNPQAVSAAKKKIMNAVISFVAFLLLYSFMQWLIPGGPF